jgi:hypothetical protein
MLRLTRCCSEPGKHNYCTTSLTTLVLGTFVVTSFGLALIGIYGLIADLAGQASCEGLEAILLPTITMNGPGMISSRHL